MYGGVEIDMLSLGNADSILISFWNGLSVHRLLIDGGNKGDAPKVRSFLRGLNVTRLDDVLSTHHHDDHSGGLIEIIADTTLDIGRVWSHVPQRHVDMNKVRVALGAVGESPEADCVIKSLDTAADIFNTALRRKIPHSEPFEGSLLGSLKILSPSLDFYASLVSEFAEADRIKAEDEAQHRYDEQAGMEEVLKALGLGDGDDSSSSLLNDPHTAPENESSVVSGAVHGGSMLLFTADAGTCALTRVLASYQVADLEWLQIPHHGSRHNITADLIKQFKPKTAFVSAEGSKKHPRRAVVNAFKEQGTRVYSTHYPTGMHLRQHYGIVPPRPGYVSATALWDAEKIEKAEPANELLAAMGGRR